jgi:hypothetical protein
MFREEDYLDPEEPAMTVQVSRNGCTWWGYLLERKTGGFDLFYDHDNSYFKPLETPKITMLRHMTERGEHLVAHLDPERNQKKLQENARQFLLSWITALVG